MLHYLFSFLGFLFFAIIHSITAQDSFKIIFLQRFPKFKLYYRAIYSLGSLIYLGIWYLYLPQSDWILYQINSDFSVFFDAIRIISAIGLIQAVLISHPFIFIGIRQLFLSQDHVFYLDEPKREFELRIKSVYRFVRHPMYFWSILFLIMNPIMSDRNLFLLIIFTAYFYWGSKPEEKKLEQRFGDVYREYKKSVPRFIPNIFKPYPKTKIN